MLYIGVTSDLEGRIWEYKMSEGSVLTARYNCTDLIYYEEYSTIQLAISREKQLKNWKRQWKDELIQKENPELKDLSADW